MTTGEWLRHAEARLVAAGIEEGARTEARVLAAQVLGVSTAAILAHPEGEFPDLAGETVLIRREAREPLAYITGKREFYGREFAVGLGVLVPRHETETLVEVALEVGAGTEGRVLDIGTGSGCLAVTLRLERPQWTVRATDLSPEAIRCARENAERLGAEIGVSQADLFPLRGPWDLIVSNPPYIARDEPLPPEVAEYEPALALFAEENGLAIYRRLAEEGPSRLTPQGWLAVEVGYRQAQAVRDLLGEASWRNLRIKTDLGGTPRVVAAQPPLVR